MLQATPKAPTSLVSIHDVMPHTLESVDELLQICKASRIDRVTLLVVPGLDWQEQQLDVLRSWQRRGYTLAGHGWFHRCRGVRTVYHWLHSRLLSRDVAEHLSLSSSEIVDLIQRCGAWFLERGFQQPKLYVPPAWAVGSLPTHAFTQLPFEAMETLTGVTVFNTGHHIRLPLVGFEADTAFRAFFLRRWNSWTIRSAAGSGKAVRISLHPFDHRLRLGDSVRELLGKNWQCLGYEQLCQTAVARQVDG